MFGMKIIIIVIVVIFPSCSVADRFISKLIVIIFDLISTK